MKQIKCVALSLLLFSVTVIHAQSLSISPNPFSQSAIIQFSLTSSDTTSLVVININGQQVKTILRDTFLSASTFSLLLNGDSLTNGVYIIKLKQGNTAKTAKVIKQSSLSAIANITDTKQITLYPNPAKNKLVLDSKIVASGISIFDVSGKEWPVMLQQNEVDISSLPSGIFYLHCKDKQTVMKFIKE